MFFKIQLFLFYLLWIMFFYFTGKTFEKLNVVLFVSYNIITSFFLIRLDL